MVKTFSEAFGNVSLTGDVLEALKDARVDGVTFSRSKKSISVGLTLIRPAAVGCVEKLSAALKRAFPFAQSVDVAVTYVLSEEDGAKRVEMFWDNITHETSRLSPVCANMLKTAQRETSNDGGGVILYVDDPKLFEERIAASALTELINRVAQTDIRVALKQSGRDKSAVIAAPDFEYLRREAADFASAESGATFKSSPGKRVFQYGIKRADVEPTPLNAVPEVGEDILVFGSVASVEIRDTSDGKKKICRFDVSDDFGAITVKFFVQKEKFTDEIAQTLKPGGGVKAYGRLTHDTYLKETIVIANEIMAAPLPPTRKDEAKIKRVELHLHTNMSQMDAIAPITDYVNRAAYWGMGAIAVTDHGVVQAFPEAEKAAKKSGVKVIYGCEGYLIDDINHRAAWREGDGKFVLSGDCVAIDFETTGLNMGHNSIIEIGAAKIIDGRIADTFQSYVYTSQTVSPIITKLTGIQPETVIGAPKREDILPQFLEWIGDLPLIAHNAPFDAGFLDRAAAKIGITLTNPYICTVEITRALFPDVKSHRLDTMAKKLRVTLAAHHRAEDDARAAAGIYLKCVEEFKKQGVETINDLNAFVNRYINLNDKRRTHIIILVKNKTGMRNLYELVSDAHLKHFHRRPRITKSGLAALREGLIIGSACESGELYTAVREQKPDAYINKIAGFYDYLEIQPIGNNAHLIRDGFVPGEGYLREINRRICDIGERLGKPVVATCDAHFLEPEDAIYRAVLQTKEGYSDAGEQPPLYFRNTAEMLREFDYLGEEKALEVVVTNTNTIAGWIDNPQPIPEGTYAPHIDGAEDELRNVCGASLTRMYGDSPPAYVTDRLEYELDAIIGKGYAVLYIIARALVMDSEAHGYVVGSRGSVGSSLAATLAGITEVNPLRPHYRCAACAYSDFESDYVKSFAGGSGCDMADKTCPVCGAALIKDGHDIPFETFMGVDGEKEPDIDLNFSGEYQSAAHATAERLLGEGYVFKAGTIGTLADKTAFGYVKSYLEGKAGVDEGGLQKPINARQADIARLARGITGVKRTTGQHPGGLVVVPKGMSIYEFCPIQRPADKADAGVTTTHFDFHSALEGHLLKLDMLGHDVPTIIKHLKDLTGIDPLSVDLGDKEIISLFQTPAAMGAKADDIGCPTGTLGIPEFGTGFVRRMLIDAKPQNFADLVRISGMSHGTGVWNGNAAELIKSGTCVLSEAISTREDIILYLIARGIEPKDAFRIMEGVRKGKGVSADDAKVLSALGVPDWYIESCRKITYLFPKGHAVAYVMMAARIAWFKIQKPLAFYCAAFSARAADFDYATMCRGEQLARERLKELSALGDEASGKDEDQIATLELVIEFYARGLTFAPIDIYLSDAYRFMISDENLMPPLIAIQGLGEQNAADIAAARKERPFFTVDDFRERTKTNKTVIEQFRESGVLRGIPESAQTSLF